jgi:hypothetical protein
VFDVLWFFGRLSDHPQHGIDLYSYSVRIEFDQDVFLTREPSMKISTTAWNANVVGIVGARNLPAVTEDVTELAKNLFMTISQQIRIDRSERKFNQC